MSNKEKDFREFLFDCILNGGPLFMEDEEDLLDDAIENAVSKLTNCKKPPIYVDTDSNDYLSYSEVSNILKVGQEAYSKDETIKLIKTENGVEMQISNQLTSNDGLACNFQIKSINMEEKIFKIKSEKYHTIDSHAIISRYMLNENSKFIFKIDSSDEKDEYWNEVLTCNEPMTFPQLLAYLFINSNNFEIFSYLKNIIKVKEVK